MFAGVSAPYPLTGTKTTFVLSDSRRARLKAVAVARRTTVTELLAEGADLVLEKYESMADQNLLADRARRAREEIRRGLFHGDARSPSVDRVVYGTAAGAGRKQATHRKRSRG
jgi:hypothetical protein